MLLIFPNLDLITCDYHKSVQVIDLEIQPYSFEIKVVSMSMRLAVSLIIPNLDLIICDYRKLMQAIDLEIKCEILPVIIITLTHSGLVMPYNDIELGQHCLR